jgi:glycosyltransferase involved in cell wall biosynthesis
VRIAQVGAFPFPFPQGSQVFFAESARSLAAAGAQPTLVCYDAGDGEPPRDLPLVRSRPAPRRLLSGPSLGKPIADAALAAALVAAHRRERFDAVVAHNAEAALAALAARPWMRRPIVYVAHTVLANELATYTPRWATALAALGARIDAFVARRVDAVVALSRAGAAALDRCARGPVVRIPPALAPAPPPTAAAVAQACARRDLAPGRYALYAGNLDGYQELATLAAAAARASVPIAVATHADAAAPRPLRTLRRAGAEETRLLTHGAAVTLLARRARGGFPIKLLNYMEAARPTIAYASIADPLVHGESGWLLADDATPAAWADAIERVVADPACAARLGAAARRVLERDHDPAAAAARLLRLLGDLV